MSKQRKSMWCYIKNIICVELKKKKKPTNLATKTLKKRSIFVMLVKHTTNRILSKSLENPCTRPIISKHFYASYICVWATPTTMRHC